VLHGQPDQTWKSKTATFRERMAEIKAKKSGDEGDEDVATEEVLEETQAAAEPEPEEAPAPKKKKKGCLGMILFFVGIGIAGAVSALQWLA
jgi:hypothetical protein